MAITVQHLGPSGTPFYSQQGRWKECICDLLLDSSYPANGYAMSNTNYAGQFNMGSILHMEIGSVNGPTSSGIFGQWDRSNNKLLFSPAEPPNPIIIEEVVTVTANAGRLANVPAYIMAMEARAGGTTGAFTVVPVGSTVATTQVAVDFTTGNLATFATDAVTQLLVTYIPMGVGPFIPANQVIDELVTLPNGTTVNLLNQAGLVQYIYESTTLKISMPIVGTQNAAAAGQVRLQLLNSANTTITDNAAQNTKIAKVTYWKVSAFGASGKVYGLTDRATTNAATNVIAYNTALAVGDLNTMVLNCYGVHHSALATNTEVPSVALGPTGTAAANSPVINPISNNITYSAGDSITREFIAYMLINPMLMGTNNGGTSRPQVPAGSNLSSYTVRARVVGF